MSCPLKSTWPLLGAKAPLSTLKNVLLPAPIRSNNGRQGTWHESCCNVLQCSKPTKGFTDLPGFKDWSEGIVLHDQSPACVNFNLLRIVPQIPCGKNKTKNMNTTFNARKVLVNKYEIAFRLLTQFKLLGRWPRS